jgi:putative transposase
MSSPELPLG